MTDLVLPSEDPRVLCLKGVFGDDIIDVLVIKGDCSAPKSLAGKLLEFIQPLPSMYRKKESCTAALWQTVLSGQPPASPEKSDHAISSYMVSIQRDDCRQALRTCAKSEQSQSIPEVDQSLKADRDDSSNDFWLQDFDHDVLVLPHATRRCLFQAKKGFLGLGPLNAEAGDQVRVIAGARTPFVLRTPHGDGLTGTGTVERRQLVGESYVHGIMLGEAMRQEGESLQHIALV